MHTVAAHTAIRLAHLAIEVSQIHRGHAISDDPVKTVSEFRKLQKKYNLPVCNDAYLDLVEKQALEILASRKITAKRLFGN
tara:strand:+ start:896 stop:1138 length:243 start_codon:yes stop_codon:yes gene_type:complete